MSNTIGSKLLALRKRKNLTQGQVAEGAGVSKRSFLAWENDQSKPSMRNMEKLAAFFGVKVATVLG